MHVVLLTGIFKQPLTPLAEEGTLALEPFDPDDRTISDGDVV